MQLFARLLQFWVCVKFLQTPRCIDKAYAAGIDWNGRWALNKRARFSFRVLQDIGDVLYILASGAVTVVLEETVETLAEAKEAKEEIATARAKPLKDRQRVFLDAISNRHRPSRHNGSRSTVTENGVCSNTAPSWLPSPAGAHQQRVLVVCSVLLFDRPWLRTAPGLDGNRLAKLWLPRHGSLA